MEIRARFIVLCLSVELIHVWFTRGEGRGGILVSTVLDSYNTVQFRIILKKKRELSQDDV